MMADTYDKFMEAAMLKAFIETPSLAATCAEVLGRLRKGGYYEQPLVDAIFQKWERFPTGLVDAYAFLRTYGDLVQGKVRVARIVVGAEPEKDKAADLNNERLRGLQPQFAAVFLGGAGDHDGSFTWHDHLHLGGNVNVDGRLVEGPEHVIRASSVALEVGTQSAAKTVFVLKQSGAFARWPYDSEDIWVFARMPYIETHSEKTDCVRDEDGWPCARSRRTREGVKHV